MATAGAQTGLNFGTAIANAMMGNVNQVTPYGSLKYKQRGTYKWTDPTTGQVIDVPMFTAKQKLKGAAKQTQKQTSKAQLNLAQLLNQQSGFLKDYMATPLDLNNEDTEARLFELGRKRLDPMLDRRRASMDDRLANQGIMLGSTAYDRAMEGVDQGENDMWNQLFLTGRGQAVQEQLTERNQPFQEIAALLSGTQMQQPNFIPTNMPQIPTTDYAGITMDAAKMNQQNYWQQQAQKNQMIGGLFGLGSSLIGAYPFGDPA